MVKNAKFSLIVLKISKDIDEVSEIESKIREISTKIIEEKGHFPFMLMKSQCCYTICNFGYIVASLKSF